MYSINERPNIVSTVSTEDGYSVRTLCLVDGFPAEIDIDVDTHRQKYSHFWIRVYNPVQQEWGANITTMTPQEVGRMPILHDEAETLAKLNEIAGHLYDMATVIFRTGRIRQAELDEEEYVCHRLALDTARERELDDLEYAEAGRLATDEELENLRDKLSGVGGDPFSAPDPLASGDHDAAEAAADAVTPGRPAPEDRL